MAKYSVRPAVMNDVEAVCNLIARQLTIDFGSALTSPEDLQKRWEGADLEADTLAAFTEGRLAGYAELRDNDSPFIYLADRNNLDLGFQLLKLLEQKAVTRAGGKVKLVTQISEKNQPLIQLFALNGYASNLSFLIMESKLAEPPPPPQWADGITVRTFVTGQDEQAVHRADEEASEDKGYHAPLSFEDWAKRMSLNTAHFDPSLWFLAFDRDELAGVCLNFLARDTNTGWVDHLGVRRAWRKRGIGKALLLHTFGEMYKRGVTTVKLSVDSKSLTNAPRLYESVGMKTVQHYHIYKKQLS